MRVMFDAMVQRNPTRSIATLAAGLWLAALACGCTPSADEVKARHESAGAPAAAAPAVKSGAASAGARDAELVMAVALSKTRLPIEVRFRLEDRPVIGQPVRVELVVTPAALPQIRSLRLHLQSGSALLLQGEPDLSSSDVLPGVALRHEIVVVPQSAGILEIEAVAAVDAGVESLSQTYAIPLVVQAPTSTG